jgi:hypothetical protein
MLPLEDDAIIIDDDLIFDEVWNIHEKSLTNSCPGPKKSKWLNAYFTLESDPD